MGKARRMAWYPCAMAALVIAGCAGTRSVRADLIYDSFSLTGPVAGTTTEGGGATYYNVQVFDTYTTDGSRLNVSGIHYTAGVPIEMPTGVIVKASIDLQVATPGDFNWLAFGFRSKANTESYYDAAPWVFVRGNGEVVGRADPADGGAIFSNGLTATPGGVTHLDIYVDTTHAQWSTSMYVNGVFDGSYTYAVNPTISYVYMGHDLASGWFDDLSVSVPEASTLALLAPSLLLVRRRRTGLGLAFAMKRFLTGASQICF